MISINCQTTIYEKYFHSLNKCLLNAYCVPNSLIIIIICEEEVEAWRIWDLNPQDPESASRELYHLDNEVV